MNERIALYRDKMKVFWNNRKKGQKIALIAAPLAAVLVISLASVFLNKDKFVPLYSNLSAQETGQIKAELDARSVPSEISDNGTTISVPEQSVDSLKVDLAAQGIPDSGSIDYSFFGKNASFGMTDNEFDVLKLDAMQTELANLMKNIQGVNDAKVMITLPNESVWANEKQGEASASIVLNTKAGYKFDDQQIKSLYHLVSKSVPNLPTDNIVIMNQYFEYFDLKGNETNSASSSFASQNEAKKEVERDIQRQVQQMLGRLVGQDKVMVSVTADLDFTQENREEKLVEPVDKDNMQGIAVSAEKINETFSGKNAQDGGVAGTGEEDTTNYSSSTTSGDGDYEKNEERINYEVNRIHKEIVESPYKIQDLGIQVMIDPSNAKGKSQVSDTLESDVQKMLGTIVRTSISKDANTKALSDNAVSDKITVSVQPFNGQETADNTASSIPLWMYIIGGALLLIIVVLIVLLVRKRRQDLDEEEYDEEYDETFEAYEAAQKAPVLSAEQQTKSNLETLAKQDPEEFAKLLRTWISED